LDKLQSLAGDLASLNPVLLKVNVVLRDLAKGAIENRNFVFDAEA
jgi:hypothetical protein